MYINDYRTKYTKKEFIEEIKKGINGKIQTGYNCPSCWNLTNKNCDYYSNCDKCWLDAVKDIKFKDEEDNTDFDITKIKSITLNELLSKRGFKTGDIISDMNNIGIVLGNKVSYLNTVSYEIILPKAYCEFIPVETIESMPTLSYEISKYISTEDYTILEPYFISIVDESKQKTIVSVEFVVGADNPKEFILEVDSDEIEIGEIIEVCTGATYQYARVKNITKKPISQKELDKYKTCRKLSSL